MLDGFTPWPPDLVRRYKEAGYWVDQTLSEVLDESAERFGPREAIAGDDGTRCSYEDLRHRSDRFAARLLELGLKPRDRVLLQLNNSADFPIVFFGLLKAGLVPVACLPQYRIHEMGFFAEVTEASAYIVPSRIGSFAYAELVEQVRQRAPGIKHVLVHGDEVPAGFISLKDLLADAMDPRPVSLPRPVHSDPMDVAVLLLSGGTTGIPKLIPKTHNDALHTLKHYSHICPTFSGTVLCFTPMAHTQGLIYTLQPTLLTGGRLVISQTADAEHILELIQKERVNMIMAPYTIWVRLINHPSLHRYDVSSMQTATCGGQRTPPEVKARVEELFGVKMMETYAMGEGLACCPYRSASTELRHYTVGHPVSPGDEVRIVDEAGEDVPEGETGEIITRGPSVIRGYYQAPEHNKAAFDSEGFYHTGDLGRRGPEGALQILGRRKDMINRGGEHISAEELDVLVAAHPAVVDAAVVAMPDEEMGERACAYVLLKAGQALTLPDLCSFLLGKGVAKFKLPERLELVPEFRMIGLGKIDKRVLREDIARKLAEKRGSH